MTIDEQGCVAEAKSFFHRICNQSNIETGHIHLPSNSKRGFSYGGMIQSTRTILAYLYDNFLDEYEYFHLCGDDVYMIVENLKEFLASDKVKQWGKEHE